MYCDMLFFYLNIFLFKGKGKWDDIMTQIAEGQKRSSENKLPLKEVKSKIFADFKPPKLIRPLSHNNNNPGPNFGATGNAGYGTGSERNRKISESRKSIASSTRSNSTLSSKSNNLDPNTAHASRRLSRQSSSVVSRSTSSASVASQVIKESYDEEVDDDETMSENTLKDFEKIRKKSSNSHNGGREGSSTSRKDFVKNNAAAVSRKNSTTSRKSSTSSGGAKANSAAATANSAQIVNGACTSRKDPSSYLRSSHRDQPDLVKVSSPNQKNQHSELGKLEHVIEG